MLTKARIKELEAKVARLERHCDLDIPQESELRKSFNKAMRAGYALARAVEEYCAHTTVQNFVELQAPLKRFNEEYVEVACGPEPKLASCAACGSRDFLRALSVEGGESSLICRRCCRPVYRERMDKA